MKENCTIRSSVFLSVSWSTYYCFQSDLVQCLFPCWYPVRKYWTALQVSYVGPLLLFRNLVSVTYCRQFPVDSLEGGVRSLTWIAPIEQILLKCMNNNEHALRLSGTGWHCSFSDVSFTWPAFTKNSPWKLICRHLTSSFQTQMWNGTSSLFNISCCLKTLCSQFPS